MICEAATCKVATCAAGWFNIDGVHTNGCECQQDATDNTGNTCATAIDKGTLIDNSGTSVAVTGKIVPNDDVDWFKFVATDATDTGTLANPGKDKYHVRVRLLAPTDGSIRVEVLRGGCSSAAVCTGGAVDFQWLTNYSDKPNQKGQDPCVTAGSTANKLWSCCAPGQCDAAAGTAQNVCCNNVAQCTGTVTQNIRNCNDQSETYYVKVYRAGAPVTSCAQTDYSLEISNGKY